MYIFYSEKVKKHTTTNSNRHQLILERDGISLFGTDPRNGKHLKRNYLPPLQH